jgi:hypothetical protein
MWPREPIDARYGQADRRVNGGRRGVATPRRSVAWSAGQGLMTCGPLEVQPAALTPPSTGFRVN